jgi:hypothetical protein
MLYYVCLWFLRHAELRSAQYKYQMFDVVRVVICSCENDKKHINDSSGKHNRRNHDNPAHRPRNHTLYDIPPILFVFQVTQKDLRSSLMMAGYCRNMYESVYRIKEWYKSVHIGYFYY